MKLYVVMDPTDSKPFGIFDDISLAKQCAVKLYDYTGLNIYIDECELNKSISFELTQTTEDKTDKFSGGMERD